MVASVYPNRVENVPQSPISPMPMGYMLLMQWLITTRKMAMNFMKSME